MMGGRVVLQLGHEVPCDWDIGLSRDGVGLDGSWLSEETHIEGGYLASRKSRPDAGRHHDIGKDPARELIDVELPATASERVAYLSRRTIDGLIGIKDRPAVPRNRGAVEPQTTEEDHSIRLDWIPGAGWCEIVEILRRPREARRVRDVGTERVDLPGLKTLIETLHLHVRGHARVVRTAVARPTSDEVVPRASIVDLVDRFCRAGTSLDNILGWPARDGVVLLEP